MSDESRSWYRELEAQRDAALALSKQLQQDLDKQRATLEARAETAEALRDEAEDQFLVAAEQSGSNDHHALARQQLQRHLARLSGASALGWLCSLAIARRRSPLLAVLCGVPCTLAANLALKYALKTRSFALVATVAVGVGAVLLKW
eukprot:1763-Heterococcus_DN1.PRE.6